MANGWGALDERHRDAIAARWAEGESAASIASAYGVSKGVIIGRIRAWGLHRWTGPRAKAASEGRVAGWTEDSVELLRSLWVEGLSASAIATRLGVSRSAVVAKIHRMRLKRPEPGLKRKRGQRTDLLGTRKPPEASATPKPPVSIGGRYPRTNTVNSRPAPVVVETQPEEPSVYIPLADITSKTCCWPENEGQPEWLFCGAPRNPVSGKGDRGYCTKHWRRSVSRRAA
jgi:GcrA cell cycle regulator